MILSIPNIATKGINTDIARWDLPPEYITEGRNFRISANAAISYGGHSVLDTAPELYNPGYFIPVTTKYGGYLVSAGASKVYAYGLDPSGTNTYDDITNGNTVSVGSEYLWSGCLNGTVLILNNKTIFPSYWYGIDELIDLPWSIDDGISWKQKGFSADVIRSHKNYLIALNLHEDIEKPDSFRWSHPADENGIPITWDEQAENATAGIQALGGDGGAIIDGLSLRDSFVIYSQNAINIIDLSGDEFIWRRRELSTTVGLLSKDCVVEVKGVHYFLAVGDILMCDGNTVNSIAHNAVRNRLQGLNTEFADRCFAFSNENRKEIWFCFPDGNNENVSTALIYQWKEQTWAIRDLPESTSFIISSPEVTTNASFDGAPGTFDTIQGSFRDGSSAVTFSEHPYSVNNESSEIHLLDPQELAQDLDTLLERTDLAIQDQIETTTITKLYPQIKGTNQVKIQVGSQDRAGGSVRWKPYQIYDPKVDRKLDVRTTGALHAWRVMSDGVGQFGFAGIDIEYQIDGTR